MTKMRIFISIGCILFVHQTIAQTSHPISEITDTVQQFVMKTLEDQQDDLSQFSVTVNHLDSRLRFEQCLEPLSPEMEFSQINQSYFTVKVSCSQPTKWSIRVPVKVQHFKPVVSAKQQLLKDHVITWEDIHLVNQDINQLSGDYFESGDELIGLVVQKTLIPGKPIRYNMVKQQTIVHRGETVKMVIQGKGFTIESSGVAQNDGIKGQTIKVKNLRSNKLVDAVVLETGLTEITL